MLQSVKSLSHNLCNISVYIRNELINYLKQFGLSLFEEEAPQRRNGLVNRMRFGHVVDGDARLCPAQNGALRFVAAILLFYYSHKFVIYKLEHRIITLAHFSLQKGKLHPEQRKMLSMFSNWA